MHWLQGQEENRLNAASGAESMRVEFLNPFVRLTPGRVSTLETHSCDLSERQHHSQT